MTLFIILCVVFASVALMVIIGEKFGKPISEKQQNTYSKIIVWLVLSLLIAGVIKALI